jgi:hypothetical protein
VSVPNENLNSVNHNKQFDVAGVNIRRNPTGVRSDSDSGGEVRVKDYSAPRDLYQRGEKPGVQTWREPGKD